MSDKKQNSIKKSGLGRSLDELLTDNEELTNVENKVLMHKTDGTTVKIYNKTDKLHEQKTDARDGKSSGREARIHESSVLPASLRPHPTLVKHDDDGGSRIQIGKTREERMDEAKGLYRMGKPHVIPDGEVERIRISARPKPEPEQERIVLGGGSRSSDNDSEALKKLKRYSPRASEEYLEALQELTDSGETKKYETDKEGRIIIGATKSRVKRR